MNRYLKRIAAAVLASAMSLTAVSCTLRDHDEPIFPETSSKTDDTEKESKASSDYETVSVDDINSHVKQLLSDIKKSGNTAAVEQDISTLMDDIDIASEASTLAYIDYCLDFNDEKNEEKYDSLMLDFYIAYEAASYAFHRGYKSAEYSELFSDLIIEENLEYYNSPAMSLKRLEGYAEVDYSISDELTDEYYDIYFDDDMEDDEKSLKCAELYLDILSTYSPDTFYENYSRDYSPEDIIALSSSIREKITPLYDDVVDKFYDDPHCEDIFSDPVLYDDLFGTVKEYAHRLSTDIAASADDLADNERYQVGKGLRSYDVSFTSSLPKTGGSMIYLYKGKSLYDLTSAIHEFGHFHAAGYDDTSTYDAVANEDVAEIQSQGMELLFLQFYDDIYGEQSNAMKLYTIQNMLTTIESSFLVGEFEYTVLRDRDDLTPELVVERYNDIMGEYAEGYPLYYIDHIYSAPGYYISYGVSALAAMELFGDCVNDPAAALERYERIARVKSNDPDTGFRSALAECGFSDVLSAEYIDALAEQVHSYLDGI